MLHLAKNKAIYLFFMLFAAQACKSPPPSQVNLRLDVKLPSKTSIKNDLICTISFTNLSAKTIHVPDYILGGIYDKSIVFYGYKLYDSSGQEITHIPIVEYLFDPRAFNNKPIPLLPGKTWSEEDGWATKMFFDKPGRYRIVFHWQGYLEDNKVDDWSHFSCEKWIEVTK
jgi:hypothetical protein